MKKIRPTEVLWYHDGIEIFVAQDQVGGSYIGVIAEEGRDFDRYMVVGTRPEQLEQFRESRLDLRTLMLETPLDNWYMAEANVEFGDFLTLDPQSGPVGATSFLPQEDFMLDPPTEEGIAIQEARERDNTVVEFYVSPPETAVGHRIGARTLANLLDEFQTVVTHAFTRSLRGLKPDARAMIEESNAHLLDVVAPATIGSFGVIFEASTRADEPGHDKLTDALRTLDSIFASMSEDDAHEQLRSRYAGHLGNSCIKLIMSLASHNTGFRYGWSDPDSETSGSGRIAKDTVFQLARTFKSNLEPVERQIKFNGRLRKVDLRNLTWGAWTRQRSITGKAINREVLEGLTSSALYRFYCNVTVKTNTRGRKIRSFVLTKTEEIETESHPEETTVITTVVPDPTER